jgi:RNA polymerase sigma-54 factor
VVGLSLTFELTMAPRLGMEVSPALVAFGELLMLPYPAMQDVVEDELQSNADLERLEPGECPVCGGSWRRRCPVCGVPSGSGSASGAAGPVPDVPAREPDSEVLRRAVRAETHPADAVAVDYLIDNLDRHGLLDRTCAQLAADLGRSEADVSRLLRIVRRCGPPGVGATSVAECLVLQLDALGLPPERTALARRVITGHLAALGRGHFAAIADALGTSRDAVAGVLELIRQRLRPYPAYDGTAAGGTPYVTPDVVIRARAGGFTVELVETSTTRLGVRAGGPGAAAARAFLTLLRDRRDTLRRVTEYAVRRQREFLAGGPLRPLTRAETAADLGLHESTVSRAVADKHALLPDDRMSPLAAFFGVSGGADEQLCRLLRSARGPLSDQRLADLMRDAGYPMARRTVAKHRARLGFASTALR